MPLLKILYSKQGLEFSGILAQNNCKALNGVFNTIILKIHTMVSGLVAFAKCISKVIINKFTFMP